VKRQAFNVIFVAKLSIRWCINAMHGGTGFSTHHRIKTMQKLIIQAFSISVAACDFTKPRDLTKIQDPGTPEKEQKVSQRALI
jgi:hypothetical protein